MGGSKKEAEIYKLHHREIYDQYIIYRAASRAGHVEYGKWLIASLLAVHGGAIYAISTLRSSVKPAQIEGLISGASWNLAGIVLVLLAAFCAWLNFQFSEWLYGEWADPAMLYRSDHFPKPDEKYDPINATLFLAALFGILSLFAFISSAVDVMQALRSG